MVERASHEGQQVPNATLAEMKDGKVRQLSTADLFKGKRVVVFALPGAFTPTCSTAHVPGFKARLNDFRAAGIDDVVCLSVNDPFVMEAWQHSEKAEGVHFIADPYAEFTQAMGMAIDHRDASLGTRSWRYSMLVDDGKIEKMFIEPDVGGDPFEVSDADTIFRYLQPEKKSLGPVLMFARHGCPFCRRAKEMLDSRGIAYEAVHLGDELSMQGVKAVSGEAKVPQVFVAGKRVGGADRLEQFLNEQESRGFLQKQPPATDKNASAAGLH